MPNGFQLPYCADQVVQTIGDPCFDETKAAAGSVYTFSLRASTAPLVRIQDFALQSIQAEVPYSEILAHAASIFPTITTVNPVAATLLINANAAGAGTSVAGIGGFSYTFPSANVTGNYAQIIVSNVGGQLDGYGSTIPSTSGTWSVPTGTLKSNAYTNATQVWRGVDADYLGYLVNTGVNY